MLADQQPRSLEDIEERAALWVELLETADANQRSAFSAWLRESPEHVAAFLEMSVLSDELELAGRAGLIDVDALLAEGAPNNVVHLQPPAGPATEMLSGEMISKEGIWWRMGTRIARSAVIGAACVAVGAIVAVLFWYLRHS